MLAIAAACWFGPAWTCDRPVWTNAAWPYAGHTVLGSAPPSAPRCSVRRTSMGDAAVEDEDASNSELRAAATTAMPTSRPAVRIRRVRIRRVVVRAGSREVMPPFKAAWYCQHVSGFRYADDMRRLLASEHACIDRRGRALHGRSHPRWPTPGSDRRRHRS